MRSTRLEGTLGMMARLEHVKTQKAERCSGFLGSVTAGRECTVLQLGCWSFARGCDLGGSELIRGTSLSSWLRRSHPSANVAVKTELFANVEVERRVGVWTWRGC